MFAPIHINLSAAECRQEICPYKVSMPRCLRTIRVPQRVVRSRPFGTSFWRQGLTDSPVHCLLLLWGANTGGCQPGKRCGIYRVALIYALTAVLFNLLKNPTSRISWTLRAIGLQTVKPMALALQSHMVADGHTCVQL